MALSTRTILNLSVGNIRGLNASRAISYLTNHSGSINLCANKQLINVSNYNLNNFQLLFMHI